MFRFPAMPRDPLPLRNVQTGSGAHQSSYSMGTGALSPGVKQLRRAVDRSPPHTAEVKHEWSYNSIPPYAFMVCRATDYRHHHVSQSRDAGHGVVKLNRFVSMVPEIESHPRRSESSATPL